MKKIREIMTDEVYCCTLKDNMYEAAALMKKYNVGCIPVVDGKKLIGLLTDRDIVIRGIAERHSGSTSINEIMSPNVVCCSPETTVDEAAELMAKHQIRRLPVVEGDELIGMVAIGDLAVRRSSDDEAGMALSQISKPAEPNSRAQVH